MVASVPELIALLDLEHVDDVILRGSAPETTLQRVFGGKVLGGQVLGGLRVRLTGWPLGPYAESMP